MNETEKAMLYTKAWAKWGDLQLIMMIEEPSELIKSVTKYLRNRTDANAEKIAEEVADTEIMCEQFRQRKYELGLLVDKYKAEKLERLKKTLEAV